MYIQVHILYNFYTIYSMFFIEIRGVNSLDTGKKKQ